MNAELGLVFDVTKGLDDEPQNVLRFLGGDLVWSEGYRRSVATASDKTS